MPKEHKHSRGRRDQLRSKRKRDMDEHDILDKKPKKPRSGSFKDEIKHDVQFLGTDGVNAVADILEGPASDRPFFGMLEDEEQEYFRRADEILELNDFLDEEQRSLFLANVFREAQNKELKIACSQSCSRLMERLILLSTVEQKKKLFEKFAGNFLHLIQHRFASHCCEMLLIKSAPYVTEELTAEKKKKKKKEENVEGKKVEDVVDEESPLMESLFLQTLDELEGNMTLLLTDRFASHTLRVLLIILSGQPVSESSTQTLLQSRRKEKVTIANVETCPGYLTPQKRPVPPSFTYAVEKIISDTIATMDPSFIRILATHPTGNPTLQLLLELELTHPDIRRRPNSDEKTLISSLLPDAIDAENSESQIFIKGLLYDAIGSRLLETICRFAPGKLFKQIYRLIFKDRIAAVSRNEISSYVAIRVLFRIGKEDLQEALKEIIPQIPSLVERNRTIIIKTLVERCYIRGADTTDLIAAISAAYGNQSESLLLKMACTNTTTVLSSTSLSTPNEGADEAKQTEQVKVTPAQLHGSLLAQCLLIIPGPPSELIQESLLSLPPPILLALSMFTSTSHIIQIALSPTLPNTFRRKLINTLIFPPSFNANREPSIAISLALSSTGSHVLDALLVSTASAVPLPNVPPDVKTRSVPLFQFAERIASIFLAHENKMRESFFGRIVWRNWSMDMFKLKPRDWIMKVKRTPIPAAMLPAIAPPVESYMADDDVEAERARPKVKKNKPKVKKNDSQKSGKSSIQLAREKFAANRGVALSKGRKFGAGTSANAGKIGL